MADCSDREQDKQAMQISLRSPSNYAFLNHSPDTFPRNMPPSIDDKPLARQRRRRTSPEDQAILEAAYNQDSKPDKAARLELVKQVALGEKEVQIWFQNRRQTSRRKSRPLLPHEVAQYHLAKTGAIPSMDLESYGNDAQRDDTLPDGVSGQDSDTIEKPASSADSKSSPQPSQEREEDDRRPTSASTSDPRISIGYLANRRSAPSLRENETVVHTSAEPPARTNPELIQSLKKSSSFVRLSMTPDGVARVTTKDSSSPSPPRRDTVLPASTYDLPVSKLPLGNANVLSNVPKLQTKLQRSSSGRSRDSRTWEFWCDKEARLDLEDKAQKDASGSAADAIGLLRSASGRTVLGSIPVKRNFLGQHQPQLQKRSKLGRSNTSYESSNVSSDRWPSKASSDLKASPSVLVSDFEGDWNKENHPPGENGQRPRLERSRSAVDDRHLARARTTSSTHVVDRLHRGDFDTHATKYGPDGELESSSDDPERDPELSTFMRGGKTGGNPREEDMDCVQGLLSLSQGNWR